MGLVDIEIIIYIIDKEEEILFKKLGRIFLVLVVGSMVFNLGNIPKARASFDANNLISDGEFIDWQALDASGIQHFLNSRGGERLRSFSEGGRSAAQIIADAALANRINPIVILATIQKEEGIIDSDYHFDLRVVWAMGYGVCDTCSLDDPNVSKYRGFTKQIDNGTWQLKRNYTYWAANGSAWNVGQTMIIDGTAIRFANRATSALYRYTPHLPGNGNFYDIYSNYKTYRAPATYSASYMSQYSGANRTIRLRPGQKRSIWVRYRNTGTATWSRDGATPARIGNSSPQDRSSQIAGDNTRWPMVQSRVRTKQGATFRITITAPNQEGTYTEKFRPLVEGITWMGEEVTFTFEVRGRTTAANRTTTTQNTNASYEAELFSQYGGINGTISLRAGQTKTLSVRYKNRGTATWSKTGANPARLGNWEPQDRQSQLTGGNPRWQMVQSSIRTGQGATFQLTITAPNKPGEYVEKFRPLVEGVTWMGDVATLRIVVR